MNDVFKTSDIVLASTLKVLGYELVDIELNGSKGTFVFNNIPSNCIELQQTLTDFDLAKILVEPVVFNNTLKQLTTSVRRKST